MHFSYGFRQGHSPHQALHELREQCMDVGIGWIVDADVRGYFDALRRSHLAGVFQHRVKDGEDTTTDWPVAARGCDGSRRADAPRQGYATRRGQYTSYNVANFLVEYSTSIPRTQLRPGYGDGFLGAPLHTVLPRDEPAPGEQGGRRGTSSTHPQHNPGGAHHV